MTVHHLPSSDSVCTAHRLRAEAPIIAAELSEGGGLDLALLAARYGARDLGVPALDGPGA